jgi:glycosyltransferase involved in cell wall biosynthesis
MTDRLRIVHIGKFYPPTPGGMEAVVQTLCEGERAFVDSQPLVIRSHGPTVREQWRGVPVTRVRRLGAIGSVSVCPAFPLHVSRIAADVVVLHEPNPVALVSDLLGRPRGRLVVWFHSEVVRPAWRYRLFYRPFLARVLDRASRIVVAAPPLAEQAAQLAGHREKCVVIPFGIDASRFAPAPAVVERARELRREHGDRLVLFVGRMVPYKGLDVLLAALRDLDARAILVGLGPSRPRIERAAREAGLAGRVVFAGAVTDAELVALYHACTAFVLPSLTRAEAFGVVQLEAMACGKPVVSTNVPTGVPWVNRDGDTGLVVPPGDAGALRGALERLLSDPELARRMGASGQDRVRREFTIEKMIRSTVALYRQVADGHAPPAVVA